MLKKIRAKKEMKKLQDLVSVYLEEQYRNIDWATRKLMLEDAVARHYLNDEDFEANEIRYLLNKIEELAS